MSRVREFLAEFFGEGDGSICLDGFDDAVLGAGIQNGKLKLVYDRDLILRILAERNGLSREGAEAFCHHYIDAHYAGPSAPILLHRIPSKGERASFSMDEVGTVTGRSESLKPPESSGSED